MKGKLLSRINETFTPDSLIDLYKVAISLFGTSNVRSDLVSDILTKYDIDFMRLGTGTNRTGFKIGEYCFKIALDYDGMTDNLREFKYSKQLQPYVAKTYECIPNGLVAVAEYVNSLNPDSHLTLKTQNEMSHILAMISSQYLIGDIGFTTKNRANWGERDDGSLCILDYAYIYDVKYNTFTCKCDGKSILHYDDDFVMLVCPTCGRKYEFREIRKRITKDQQDKEIGDIRNIGYCLHEREEVVELNPEFSVSSNIDDKERKKLDKAKLKKEINSAIKKDNERLKKLRKENSYEKI